MLDLSDVTKRFGEEVAVDSVDLSLLSGERLCLLGHNGAGKTTLMRMITGMARPTEGRISLLGKDPLEAQEVRRCLGYLSDKPYIYDKLTGREHLRLHAALYGLPAKEIEERGTTLLEDLEMGASLDQRAEIFSFGMQKKLALVLALAHEPLLLVLDEPLNGLDPGSAERVEDLIRGYTADARAVVLSTHSVEFAARFANRVGVMHQGSLTLHATEGSDDARWIRSLLPTVVKSSKRARRAEGKRA